ncbi:hypothetical protein PIB30_073547 [Stylosanthes scabra]|uniref:Uncharacterized protein n=1 Tax=Stylosanthes scabra TaxID=79078 RepID=A0ABU6YPS0_9FABA|nr:hypothetical protein [Stylosanthes scabra]
MAKKTVEFDSNNESNLTSRGSRGGRPYPCYYSRNGDVNESALFDLVASMVTEIEKSVRRDGGTIGNNGVRGIEVLDNPLARFSED